MSPAALLTTDILAAGTLALNLASLLILGALLLRKREALAQLARYALPAAFALSLAASILTLVYSEAFSLAPCGLCWLERAFLYPIPVITGIALWARDTGVGKYVIGLTLPGAVIALYHHYLQMGGSALIECPAAPGAADCAQRFIFEFGYITFPWMAFSAFVFLGLLMLAARPRA